MNTVPTTPFSTILLLLSLLISNFSFAQDCNGLTRDDITNPGMYTVATLTEADGIRNGPEYSGATVYYPTNATGPFPGIVFVPGFFSPQSSVQAWGPFLASHGIVTMTVGTNSLFDFPGARRDALLDGIETLRQENTRAGSPLLGNIDVERFAVAGWSMGGGGAQLAGAADPSLKAVMALCPWLDGPTPSDLDHAVPLLILSGQDDPTAPPNSHANVHYDYTPATTDKLIFEVAGGDHGVANDPIGAQDDIGKIGLSWLKRYLVGDDCYCPLLIDTPATASRYDKTIICPAPCPISIIQLVEIIPDNIYHAGQVLESEGTIPSGGNVVFKAGQEIDLKEGFTVELGADFEALIEGCGFSSNLH